jgi:DNA-directed RNA polymerase subunit RPC12/RpoP
MSTKPQQPLPKQVNVDISQADDVKCDECGHDVFVPVFHIKKVSAIMSPNGQEIIAPVQVFGCNKCGHVNKEFMPREA